MTIGERRVVAQIREKQQARVEYDAAKSAGKSAALLEQHRPNVFKMSVANILPGDDIEVELRYTELVVPTEFRSTSSSSRRSSARATSARRSTRSPRRRARTGSRTRTCMPASEPTSGFTICTPTINSGIPIKDAASSSHRVHIALPGRTPRRRRPAAASPATAATATSSCATSWPAAASSPG